MRFEKFKIGALGLTVIIAVSLGAGFIAQKAFSEDVTEPLSASYQKTPQVKADETAPQPMTETIAAPTPSAAQENELNHAKGDAQESAPADQNEALQKEVSQEEASQEEAAQQAAPVNEVVAEPVSGPAPEVAALPSPAGIVVVELFTSRGCVFCPQADVLFNAMVEKPNVIGIACHISYFDTRLETMVRPFCMQRQSWYMNALKAGPNYTPQMIFNGHDDVVGYRAGSVIEALSRAASENIKPLSIKPANEKSFTVTLPNFEGPIVGNFQLSVFMLDKTRQLPGLFEPFRGKKLTFARVADAMRVVDVRAESNLPVRVDMDVMPGQERLVAILQNKDTGAVIAAGAYILSRNPS